MNLVKHTHDTFSHHPAELDSVRAQLARADGERKAKEQRAKIRAITTEGHPIVAGHENQQRRLQALAALPLANLDQQHRPVRTAASRPASRWPTETQLHRVDTLKDLPEPNDGCAFGHLALQNNGGQANNKGNRAHDTLRERIQRDYMATTESDRRAIFFVVAVFLAAIVATAAITMAARS